jgi:hypothetical protein
MIKAHRYGVCGVLVLTLLVALALTAAPAASAKAWSITMTGAETWAAPPDPA